MKHRFKTLGLTLVAVFALSVVAAQAASAHTFVSATGANGFATGHNNKETKDKFTVGTILGPGTVECNVALFEGTIENGSESATVHPTYTGCEFLGSPATVDTNSCNYTFHGATTAEMAKVDVGCTGEEKIEVDVPGICKLLIGSQNGLDGVNYTNIASTPSTVGVKATVGGIALTKTAPSSGSNNCSLVTGTTGEYNSTDTVEGFTDSTEATKLGISVTNP